MRRWLAADEWGSVISVTNASGATVGLNTYDEYGSPCINNIGRFQYTGQAWLPSLKLHHYKARAYSPVLGRFLQTDPVGYVDDVNLYAYVRNDPLNKTDSSGQTCTESNGKYSCVVDQVPKDAAPQQLKDIARREKRYTAAVNKLMSKPDREATVKVSGHKAFTVTAGEVGKSLIKAQVKAEPGTPGGRAREAM